MSQSSVITALQRELVNPKGTQEGEEYLPSSSHQTTATPYGESWGRKLRKRKHRKLAPYSRGAYQRNDFSEPRLLHLLIFRKALNSLMWDIWFSLIYKKAFDIYTTCLCCKTYSQPGSSPCFLGSVLSGSLEMLEVLKIPTFRNSQLLGCEFFLSQQYSLRNIIFHDSTTFILYLFYDMCRHPFLLGIWVALIFYLFIH